MVRKFENKKEKLTTLRFPRRHYGRLSSDVMMMMMMMMMMVVVVMVMPNRKVNNLSASRGTASAGSLDPMNPL